MQTNFPGISVIIPTYNSEKSIVCCLESVIKQTLSRDRYEIIVVDDGSSDGTQAGVDEYPGVKFVKKDHAGPAAARNLGAELASGAILVFTDLDCAPAPDWLEKMVAPFYADKSVMGVKGVYKTNQKALVPRFVQLEYETKYDRMARQHGIDFIDTYSAAYRKSVFIANGGFDKSFPVPSVEDQEFSFRLARKGYYLVFVNDAAVYHTHDPRFMDYYRRKFGIGYWKTVMLRWVPEKLLSDSHTLPSQRIQIILLGIFSALLVLEALGKPVGWFLAASSLLFFIIDSQFIKKIVQKDPGLLGIAPVMLVTRAISLGVGLLCGYLFPPKHIHKAEPGLSFGVKLIKRVSDVGLSLVGLVLSSPLTILSAIAIRLDGPGPILYTQERAGQNGKPFRMVKLRTMEIDADKRLNEVMELNPLKGPVYKIPNDPRVTRVGRFLRRWSLDELPQLWNILRGEMSLVGPRPEELWVVETYNDQQRMRLAVKPGLTGPMQVCGRGGLDMDERMEVELSYIQNYSLWKDFSILISSVNAVISGRGAF